MISQTKSMDGLRRVSATRLPFVIAIVALILVVFHSEARANVKFCNQTNAKASVAIAYSEKDAEGTSTGGHRGVRVEGWWGLEPGECKVVSTINAGDYWVYYHAHSSESTWTGGGLLCVASERFLTGGPFKDRGASCRPGYRLEGFRRMNTAAKNHTHNLTR